MARRQHVNVHARMTTADNHTHCEVCDAPISLRDKPHPSPDECIAWLADQIRALKAMVGAKAQPEKIDLTGLRKRSK